MKVVALIFLLAGLLLVTVLISPAFAATGVVSLPAVTGRFLQVEFSDLAGITMNGQTLSIDFAFSTPFHVDGRPLWSELFLQTAPHTDPDSQEDYPYTQYVVFGTGTRAYVTAENGDLLDAPTPTAAVLLTDRGLAGAAMTANPPIGIKVAGIHFDLVLPDTGETLVLGRIAVKIEEGADDSNPSHLPDSPGNSDNNSRRDTTTSISVTNQTASGASISWSTDKIDTFVEVGTTPSYGQQIAPQSQESGNYSVNVSGLASNTTYHYRITSRDGEGNITTSADHTFITSFSIPNEGGTVRTTAGNVSLVAGYGRPQRESGGTPSGLAIFENRQSGLLVNEVAVPAVPSMYSGRIPIEVSVDGSINTGIAIANPNSEDAWISFDLRTAEGNIYQSGSFILSGASTPCDPGNSCNHLSQFVDDSPLFGGRNIEGTLSFTSTVPISLIAVRSFVNERGDFLMTNVPVTDLSLSAVTAMQVVPQFSVGNGMKTEIALMNPTGMELRGRMEFLDPSGAPALVKVGGSYSHTVQTRRPFA